MFQIVKLVSLVPDCRVSKAAVEGCISRQWAAISSPVQGVRAVCTPFYLPDEATEQTTHFKDNIPSSSSPAASCDEAGGKGRAVRHRQRIDAVFVLNRFYPRGGKKGGWGSGACWRNQRRTNATMC